MNYLDEEIYFDEQDFKLINDEHDHHEISQVTTFKECELKSNMNIVNVAKLCAKILINGEQSQETNIVNSVPRLLENFSNLKEVKIENPFIGKMGTKDRFIQLGKVIHYIDNYLNEVMVIIENDVK